MRDHGLGYLVAKNIMIADKIVDKRKESLRIFSQLSQFTTGSVHQFSLILVNA
jgi:hypothetical protein